MGKNSRIAWTDHTFNPWWGCTKVSEGCAHCYAEGLANRLGYPWGSDSPRRFFPNKHWEDPLKWAYAAEKKGIREVVFTGSMCDVLENRSDLVRPRQRLFRLIMSTRNRLSWLILSKRSFNFVTMLPKKWLTKGLPRGVFIGTTVENQANVNRIEDIQNIKGGKFISVEPMLGPVELGKEALTSINWVIVGGESGYSARPMDEDWVRALRDQCVDAGVAFFYKQKMGEDGKMIETPELDGQTWTEFPKGLYTL